MNCFEALVTAAKGGDLRSLSKAPKECRESQYLAEWSARRVDACSYSQRLGSQRMWRARINDFDLLSACVAIRRSNLGLCGQQKPLCPCSIVEYLQKKRFTVMDRVCRSEKMCGSK